MTHDEPILEQAALWAARTSDPDFADWDEFLAWLEQDPAHSAAYDRVKAAVEDAVATLHEAPGPVDDSGAVNDNDTMAPVAFRGRFAWAAGMAAAVAALFGAWLLNDPTYSIETRPGASQLVALEGGGEVLLAGGTRMTFDRDNPELVVLDRGQALFTLTRDASRPLEVKVGDERLVDIGTVFDVKYTGTRVAVAVSDGAVMLNPGEENVTVAKGQQLLLDTGRATYQIGRVPLAQVGEWRAGRLTFRDEPLGDVASDLSRATGLEFRVAAGAAEMRVSGSLLVDPLVDDPHSLGALLGVTVTKSADQAWVITGR
ncbi:MAG TPA: FecR domain-containing protein [Erythrobacter sp.]|nr:FecR domain-containing protein [Erythrobacter sp.]